MEAALPLIAAFVGDRTSSDTAPQSPLRITKTTTPLQLAENFAASPVRVVVFSKDRPFQLRSLLRSIKKYVFGADLDIVVIWRADNANSYEAVIREFRDGAVAFVHEKGCGDFRDLLTTACTGQDFVLFCVDDALMYRRADLRTAKRVLVEYVSDPWVLWATWSARRDPRILAFQLKLSPHVCWSHPAAGSCPVPHFEIAAAVEDTVVLVWERSTGELDWDYGWDLCCSLYRTVDVEHILSQIPTNAVWHPNSIEALGSAELKRNGSVGTLRPHCACFASPVLSVLAINRVQDVYHAPIYSDVPSLEQLNELVNNPNAAFDDEYYARRRFSSAHIGTVILSGEFLPDTLPLPEHRVLSTPPLVTVIIPTLNAATTIVRAIKSVLHQTLRNITVLVIDDGSTDDTLIVAGTIVDRRLRIVSNSRQRGIAGALNCGLVLVSSMYVARLDADDECYSDHRLATQYEYLQGNPHVTVLGGAALTFVPGDSPGKRRIGRYCYHPCDPINLAWSLYFSCHITHPTIMARASGLRMVGGYSVRPSPESRRAIQSLSSQEAIVVRHAEDYDLWLRLTERKVSAIANLSEPLAWIRKSTTSVSAVHRLEQEDSALAAAYAAVCRRLSRCVDMDAFATLRRPSSVTNAALLAKAGDLLLFLELAFLSSISKEIDAATRQRAIGAVKRDVDARLTEIALCATRCASATTAANQIFNLLARRPSVSLKGMLAKLSSHMPSAQ